MQIGINLWVWGAPMNTERVESTVPKAAELGFDAVEIPLVDPDLLDYDRTAAVLEEHDLDVGMVVAMSEDRDLLQEDPDVRANGRSTSRPVSRARARSGRASSGDRSTQPSGGPGD